MIDRDQATDRKYEGRDVSAPEPVGQKRLPSTKEHERPHTAASDDIRIFGHEERGKLHARVLGVEAGDEFVLGFGKVERDPIRLGESGDQKQQKTEDLRPGSLENCPTGQK